MICSRLPATQTYKKWQWDDSWQRISLQSRLTRWLASLLQVSRLTMTFKEFTNRRHRCESRVGLTASNNANNDFGSDPKSPLYVETGARFCWDHARVRAKKHIASNGCSSVHECDRRQTDRQTDRPRSGNICPNSRHRRCFQWCRLIIFQSSVWISQLTWCHSRFSFHWSRDWWHRTSN